MSNPSRLAVCVLLAAVFAASPLRPPPGPAAAAAAAAPATDPSPAAPRTVVFVAGTHTAFRFDPAGNVTASRTSSFIRASSAPAATRATIVGRGVYLGISAGVFAGYWVRESTLAYVQGVVGEGTFPSTPVPFAAGTFLGYRFTPAWGLAAAKPARLASQSMAHANGAATINGRPYIAIVDGVWAGFWVPGSVSAPAALACRAGNRAGAGTAQVIRSVATTAPRMSVTFDMGGRLDPARSILDLLIVNRTCATIFITGDAAATSTGTAVLSIVRAHPELFEIGNHTMHHCDLVNGGGASTAYCPTSRPGSAFVKAELGSAASIGLAKTGQPAAPYWRPPYGAYDSAVVSAAAAAGYTKTFLWSIDTIDWKPVSDGGPTALRVAEVVRAGATKGAIVLMHLGGYTTLDALPYALDGIRSKGLTPTSLSDLLH